MTNRVIPLEVKGTVNTIINGKRRRTVEEHEKYVDMRNACYRKRSNRNRTINYFTGFDDGFEQAKKQLEEENILLRTKLDALSDGVDWKALADKAEVTKKLTEAKEIIRWFVVYEKGEGIITNYNNFLEQAEQFLNSEVKNDCR